MQPGRLGVLSARRSLTLFLGFVVCLAIWQIRLTWRLMDQDRKLEEQHSRERLEQVSDLALSRLERAIRGWEQALSEIRLLPPDRSLAPKFPRSGVFVSISPEAIAISPKQPLLFVPEVPIASDPRPDALAMADELELRQQQYDGAMAALKPLLNEPATRPEALLRVARIQRKMNRPEAALTSYKQLEAEDSLSSSGVPYALMASIARCRTLAEMGQPDALTSDASLARNGLLEGRWPVRREVFDYYWTELRRFDPGAREPPKSSVEFSELISELHGHWQAAVHDASTLNGRGLVLESEARARTMGANRGVRSSFLLWHATPSRLVAFLTGPDWLGSSLGLPPDIQSRLNPPAQNDAAYVVRSLADLQLSGRVAFFEGAVRTDSQARRSGLWLAGVVLMLMLVLASAYAVYRAINHELHVARLQADFVAAVSHEFRSPLTALRTLTELLVEKRITDEGRRQRSYLFLDRETTRLQRLVEDLLDFGRMESGRKQYRFGTYDAFQLVRTAIADFTEEATAKGFQVQTDLGMGAANIRADEEAFNRAIRNLLENAVKYSPECRTVWVDAAADERRVRISVRDQGLGIPPGEQREVFRKFVRGAAAKKAGIKGTGIGLSMVHQIAKAFGGEIQLESKIGAGSTFTLVLPLVRAEENAAWAKYS